MSDKYYHPIFVGVCFCPVVVVVVVVVVVEYLVDFLFCFGLLLVKKRMMLLREMKYRSNFSEIDAAPAPPPLL